MSSTRRQAPGRSRLKTIKRKAISGLQTMIKAEPLQPGQSLPLVIQPAIEGVNLSAWAENSREWLHTRLLEHGGILFRNFPIASATEFEQFIVTVAGELMAYGERSSPRSHVSGHIYTSTDYPADQRIFLHNENAYARVWPLQIFFFCDTPPTQGGETPLADVRKVPARLSTQTREQFQAQGVMYVRNLSDELGLNWQTVFQTTDRAEVETYCRQAGYEFEWKDGNGLRTRRVAPAMVKHVQTGEMLWFNHATFFHVSTLEPATRDALLDLYDEIDLANHTYYGDGSPIELETLDELRQAYTQEAVTFSWQKGDLLMLDNMLTAHGRASFVGPRKILTGMARPFHYQDL
ncbi:hypothetical protein NKDENANG_00340 [Candidatus Entotheonellaceae bacterium PAL068K]